MGVQRTSREHSPDASAVAVFVGNGDAECDVRLPEGRDFEIDCQHCRLLVRGALPRRHCRRRRCPTSPSTERAALSRPVPAGHWPGRHCRGRVRHCHTQQRPVQGATASPVAVGVPLTLRTDVCYVHACLCVHHWPVGSTDRPESPRACLLHVLRPMCPRAHSVRVAGGRRGMAGAGSRCGCRGAAPARLRQDRLHDGGQCSSALHIIRWVPAAGRRHGALARSPSAAAAQPSTASWTAPVRCMLSGAPARVHALAACARAHARDAGRCNTLTTRTCPNHTDAAGLAGCSCRCCC